MAPPKKGVGGESPEAASDSALGRALAAKGRRKEGPRRGGRRAGGRRALGMGEMRTDL